MHMPSKQDRQNEICAQLKAAGEEYEAARYSLANTRNALEPLIRAALKAGLTPGEVQQLSHLSAETIRTARRAAGLPPAPRGGARQPSA